MGPAARPPREALPLEPGDGSSWTLGSLSVRMASSHLSSSFRASLKASYLDKRAYQVALVGNNCPADVGDVKAVGSIPGSGRSPGGGSGYHPSILG